MHNRECNKIFLTKKPLILASASPRRKQLLESVGIDFTIVDSNIIEDEIAFHEKPDDVALNNATKKALEVSRKFNSHYILGADTIVCFENKIFGKPKDKEHAKTLLKKLKNKWHDVYTGVALAFNCEIIDHFTCLSSVFITDLNDNIIEAYINTNEPMDKAGAYAIQGIGAFMVEKIKGSYSNIVGLPLNETISLLYKHDIIE